MGDDKKDSGRDYLKDGTFIEYSKNEDYHVHYDPRGGSDIPVAVHDNGPTENIRNTPISELKQND